MAARCQSTLAMPFFQELIVRSTRNSFLTLSPVPDSLRLRPAAVALAAALLPAISPAADGLFDLGTLGGTSSGATAVSADGKVVVGQADTPIGSYHATRWSGSAIPDLGTLGGRNSSATAVSADGSVVVGNSDITSNAASHAFRWTQSVGMADLGTLGGGPSSANAVSADGSVVVGDADTTFFKGVYHAFRWTQTGGMADLGTLGGMYSYANAVSADGRVVVGYADTGNAQRAFRWTQASGMQSVEQWLAANGVTVAPELATRSATAASADGSVVVGQLANSNAFVARVAPLAGLIDVADFNRTLQGAGVVHARVLGIVGAIGLHLEGIAAIGRQHGHGEVRVGVIPQDGLLALGSQFFV